MSTRTRAGCVAGVVVLALLAMWFGARGGPDAIAERDAPAGEPVRVSAAADVATVADPRTDSTVRTALATEASRADDGARVPGASFRVVEGRSKQPASAVAVSVALADGRVERLLTDAGGSFSLASMTDVRALSIDVPAYFPLRLDRELIDALVLADGVRVIEVWPRGALTVRVRRDDGTPVVGASVQVYPGDPVTRRRSPRIPLVWPQFVRAGRVAPSNRDPLQLVGTTNTAGEVHVPALPCGMGLVATVTGNVPEESQYVELPADTCRASVDLVVRDSALVKGILQYEDAQPAPEVVVQLYTRARNAGFPKKSITDERGAFQFSGVPIGRNGWNVLLPSERPRTLDVAAAEVDLGVVVVARPATVRGRVVRSDVSKEDSFAAVTLSARQSGAEVARRGADSSGSFELAVRPGAAIVLASVAGGPLTEVSVVAPCDDVVLDLDAACAAVTFRTSAPDVEAWLVRTGDRSAGLLLARDEFGGVLQREDEGAWRVSFVPPGVFDVEIRARDAGVCFRTGVVCTRGAVTDLGEIEFASGSVRGTVRASGKPLGGFLVCATRALVDRAVQSADVRETVTDADGRFVLDGLAVGPWSVHPKLASSASSAAKAIDVAAGGMHDVEIVIDAFAALRGRVTARGVGVKGAVVSLRARADAWISNGQRRLATDKAGAFAFDDVIPGEYVVSVVVQRERERPQNVLRAVHVAAGAPNEIAIEIDESSSVIALRDRGEPVVDVASAQVFTRAGHVDLRLDPSELGIATAVLGKGPWLFVVQPMNANVSVPNAPVGTYYGFVDCDDCDAPAEMTVELALGEVRVRLADDAAGWSLPLARILDFGGFEPLIAAGKHMSAYREDQADGARAFRYLPARARVRVYGAGPDGALRETVLLHDGSGVVELVWPPLK